MPRRRPANRRTGAAVQENGEPGRLKDSVDRIVDEWAAERPDLSMAPIEVLTRLSRVRTRIDDELATVFSRFDLSAADFTVIAALRRAGHPFTLPQSVLMGRLGLTSGTVSVRLSRLEDKGVVNRAPSSDDGRGVLVALTPKGADLFDQVVPHHLANEDLLLSALTDDERSQLADLLRKLLVGFEHEQSASPLGFTVLPAHATRRARSAVGLSDRAGLLVHTVDRNSPADAAGLQPGDVVLGVAESGDHLDEPIRPLRSCVDLAAATATATSRARPVVLQVLRGEQERRAQISTADTSGP